MILKYFDDKVSILVLMDLCIKTLLKRKINVNLVSFNPCFNGSMYKNPPCFNVRGLFLSVSILVLMDLCIKTNIDIVIDMDIKMFQSLF